MSDGHAVKLLTEEASSLPLWREFKLIPPLAFLIGGVHQITYWKYFDIDVVEYLGLSDLLRLSIIPMVWLIPIITILSTLMWAFDSSKLGEPRVASRTVRNGRSKGETISIWIIILVSAALLGALIWSRALWERPEIIVFMGAGFLLQTTWKNDVLKSHIVATPVRRVAIVTLMAGPLFSWNAASTQAKRILEGDRYLQAQISATLSTHLGIGLGADLRFIGHVNEYDFLWWQDRVIALRSDEVGSLILTPHGDSKSWFTSLAGMKKHK